MNKSLANNTVTTMTIDIPQKGFVDGIERYRKRKPTVTLAIERDVVAPVMFRNSNSDRAESREFGDTLHAQVNGEKFVAKERLTGLDLLRRLSDEYGDDSSEWKESMNNDELPPGLISSEYTHNEPEGINTALNLETLTYGIAGTGDQEYGLKSHVYEGYTYSLDEYDIMRKEVRNAVFESGTMQDEDGDQASALFELAKIHPGNSFVHFVTIEAGTPGMFLYVLHNILNTGKYGARETRSGKTIHNNIRGVILSEHDTALATAQFIEDYYEGDVASALENYISDEERVDWDVYGDEFTSYPDYPDWYQRAEGVAKRRADDADRVLYEHFRNDTEDALTNILDAI